MVGRTSDIAGRRPTAAPRGFTLIESMVVLGVVAVLAAMGLSAYEKIRGQNDYASSANEAASRFRQLKAEAIGRGSQTVLVVDVTTGTLWTFADPRAEFSFATFDPTTAAQKDWLPAPGFAVPLYTNKLSKGASIVTVPLTMPAPFASVPAANGCTFCASTSGGKLSGHVVGAIKFQPDGRILFEDPTGTGVIVRSGSFTIGNTANNRHLTLVAIAAGTVATFPDL